MLNLALAAAFVVQAEPKPIDAFRSNLSNVHADIDFECTYYYGGWGASRIVEQLRKFEEVAGPVESPAYKFEGRWGYDGTTEHYVLRPNGGRLAEPDSRDGPLPSCELISDGALAAYHYLRADASLLYVDPRGTTFPLVGPLTWCMGNRFDMDLASRHAGADVQRVKASWGGRPTEVEIYEKTSGDFRLRDEVWYDPSIGHLPRFIRGMAYGVGNGESNASVREVYVTDARACAAGGFAPTEWYSHMYHVDNFTSAYPSYDHTTKLSPSDGGTLVRFHTLAFTDRTTPVRLEHLEAIDEIVAPGGWIDLKSAPSPMTLAELRSKLGAKTKAPKQRPPVANIDVLELNEFTAGSRSWTPMIYVIGGLAAAILLIGLAVARRRSTARQS